MSDLNIINPQDIEDYLVRFAGDDSLLQKLLIAAMANIIKKEPEGMEELTALPEDAPDWLREKWNTSTTWHKFDAKKNIRLAGRIYDVCEWLEYAIENNVEWVSNTDNQGRPKKLLKISSFEQLKRVMEKDELQIMAERRKMASKLLVEEKNSNDTVNVMYFDDGHRIVKLNTEKALDNEGDYLEHCIGRGNYDHSLSGNVTEFYSLRDRNNMPCASMRVDKDQYTVTEIRGRRNGSPKGKHIKYIATFCAENSLYMSPGLAMDEGFTVLSRVLKDSDFNAS